MEERKLNFDTPLMSVRRFASATMRSSSTTIPSYNCDSNMDQVTETVAVPFMWEMIPGTAKSQAEASRETLDQVEVSHKASEDQVSKESLRSSAESANIGRDETGGTDFDDDNNESDFCSDAFESQSPLESVSFSFSYSVSGLSGSDGSPSQSAGTFSVNPQTRDLMMKRFLPAAKAMALETPQHTSRKQQQLQKQQAIVPYEQQKGVEIEPVRDVEVIPEEHDSIPIQEFYEHDTSEDESKEQNSKVEDDYKLVHGRGCGLIPKLCLLHHIHWLKIRSWSSSPVPPKAKTPSKDRHFQAQNKSAAKNADGDHRLSRRSLTNKLPEPQKPSAGRSHRFNFSGELQKTRGSLYPLRRRADALPAQQIVDNKHRSVHGSPTPRLHAPGTKSFSGGYRHFNYSGELRTIRGFPNGGYRPFNLSGELQPMRGALSPHWHSRADDLLTQHNHDRNRGSQATPIPKLRGHEGKPFGYQSSNLSGELWPTRGHQSTDAFCIQQKERSQSPLAGVGFHNFSGEVGSIMSNRINISPETRRDHMLRTVFGAEKTLYVDRINVAGVRFSSSNSSDQNMWVDKKIAAQEAFPGHSTSQKSSETSDSFTSKDLILCCCQDSKGDDTLPPFLKSPSESWLYRALPSQSPYISKKPTPKLASHETKWETIVKSSKLHQDDRIRYSEKLISLAAQKLNSKS